MLGPVLCCAELLVPEPPLTPPPPHPPLLLPSHTASVSVMPGWGAQWKDGKERVGVVHMDGVAAGHGRVRRRAEEAAGPSWKRALGLPRDLLETTPRMPLLTVP